MFAAAADQLAAEVSPRDLASGSIFPPISDIRRVTARIAEAVVRATIAEGVARRPLDDAQIAPAVAEAMWEPVYLPMVPVAAPASVT
jgi:malic enzyme